MKTFRLSYQQYAQALANYAYLENISPVHMEADHRCEAVAEYLFDEGKIEQTGLIHIVPVRGQQKVEIYVYENEKVN
jgi:hypothetical protein